VQFFVCNTKLVGEDSLHKPSRGGKRGNNPKSGDASALGRLVKGKKHLKQLGKKRLVKDVGEKKSCQPKEGGHLSVLEETGKFSKKPNGRYAMNQSTYSSRKRGNKTLMGGFSPGTRKKKKIFVNQEKKGRSRRGCTSNVGTVGGANRA